MAFDTAKFRNINGDPSAVAIYMHDAVADSMVTVLTAGYFNNSDDDQNLAAGDMIFSQCSDGEMWHKVSAVSSGSVTSQLISGEGPWHGDKSTASATLPVGVNELGTGTASSYITPTPYIGAKLTVFQSGTSTTATIAVSSSGVTFNAKGDTTITLSGGANDSFTLLGVSITQWAVMSMSGPVLS